MTDAVYIVRHAGNTDIKDRSTQDLVRAARVEEDGDRVFFIREDGTLSAFFQQSAILDWRLVSPDEIP